MNRGPRGGRQDDPQVLIRRYNRQRDMSESCRKWQRVSTTSANDIRGPDDVPFTLMSYNILAQDLLEMHPDLYNNHDQAALSWAHRYDRLIAEINLVKPDILCLQELQEDCKEQFAAGLENFNFEMIYKQRTGGMKTDGCAIFYRADMFERINYQDVEFYQPHVEFLDRENVAIIVKLALKSNPSQTLVVATTHLLYNPRRQDVRLAQVQVLLAELDRLSFIGYYDNGKPKYAPTIVTGDFNLQPYSAPYMLVTTGFLQYENLNRKTLEPCESRYEPPFGKTLLSPKLGITDDCRHECLGNELDESYCNAVTRLHHSSQQPETPPPSPTSVSASKFGNGILRHQFQFTSAYRHNLDQPDEEASTFQTQWITVDYLFYTRFHHPSKRRFIGGDLQLMAIYTLPTVFQAREIRNIPNMYFGSDHFSLAGKFLLKAPGGGCSSGS
ncbi:protein angel homolog 2 isoform X2 [Uranotaenia lowii]|nr:protein angel homolog 2 isoform X2 [Uranotaenia lowii]